MAFKIFGFEFGKKKGKAKVLSTVVSPENDDGASVIGTDTFDPDLTSGSFYTGIDIDQIPTSDLELILVYRELSLQQDVDEAIHEICNEAIINDEFQETVSIIFHDEQQDAEIINPSKKLDKNLQKKITAEFSEILRLLNFRKDGYGIFRRWYIDGRLFLHKIIDENNPKKGIQKTVYIDPLNIRLIKEVKKKKTENGAIVYDLNDIREYYLYSQHGFSGGSKNVIGTHGIPISKDSVTYVPSGLNDPKNRLVLGYLYKVIKPFNNLKLLEDSLVIYRVTRAPERRVYYIDVGSMPKPSAEKYISELMNRFKTKQFYDPETGKVDTKKKFTSMVEDFWLPRREGGRGTEIDTLQGGQGLGEIEDVNYFKEKLYRSFNIPLSRLQSQQIPFNFGRTSEITRDEVKFNKFIQRLRKKFSELFLDLLKTQLILKNIIKEEEWDELEPFISFDFLEDNYYSEIKETEMIRQRYESLRDIEPFIGKYISNETVRRIILRQTDEVIEREDKLIRKEGKDDQFMTHDEKMMRLENEFEQENDNTFSEPGEEDKKLPLVPDEKEKPNKEKDDE